MVDFPKGYTGKSMYSEIEFMGERYTTVMSRNKPRPIKYWHDITQIILEFFYKNYRDIFEKIASDYPLLISKTKPYKRNGRYLFDGYYLITKASTSRYYAERMKYLHTTF